MDTQLELLTEKWDGILQTIRRENDLSKVAFETWLLPLKIFRIEDHVLKITAPFEQAVTYVENKYKIFLYVAVAEAMGEEYEIEIITEDEASKEKAYIPQPKKIPAPVPMDDKKTNLNPKYTFDTFVIGSNNRFAHAASVAVAESPGKEYNPLFLYGGVGLGKTHLMHSVAHYILQKDPTKKVLYVTSEVFTNELIDSIRNGNNTSMTKFREKYRNIDVLLIDDVQFIIGKESTQEEFFHTFNSLFNGHKQIVLSSDRPASEISNLEPRLSSRFESGLTVEVQSPNLETRLAILQQKRKQWNVKVSDSILLFLAERIRKNVRRLEGGLMRVATFASLSGDTPDIARVESLLRDILREENAKQVTIDAIQRRVSEYFDIRLSDMASRRRPASIAFPRQIAMYLSRRLTNVSLQDIGEAFGGRDHGTVIHANKTIEAKMKTDSSLKDLIARFDEELR